MFDFIITMTESSFIFSYRDFIGIL